MASEITPSKFYSYIENLPYLLKQNKVRQSEAALALGWSREYFNRKINNPNSWKLGELIDLETYILGKNTA
jgi:hypothetical protein